jgi:hypothetical protein
VRVIRNSIRLFDPTHFEFREFLLSKIGSDGRLPYWAKCLCFSAALYSIGILANFASNTLLPQAGGEVKPAYLADYFFMVLCTVMGCALAFLISTLRKLDDSLMQVSKRIGISSTSDDAKRLSEFFSYIQQWMPSGDRFFQKPRFWYYLDTVGGALLGALIACYVSVYPQTVFWGSIRFTVSAIYYVFFGAVLTYVIGAVIFASMGSVKAIRRYCKEFITQDRVVALNPDKLGGLRPLGQFSLGLDIAFALPSFVMFSYLAQGYPINQPLVILLLVLYTIALVVIFFVPLGAAHGSMLAAKEKAYDQIHQVFNEINSKMSTKNKEFDFKQIKALKETYFMYEKVSKMAVWPLNIDTVFKFLATSSFPIVGSIIVDYISKAF